MYVPRPFLNEFTKTLDQVFAWHPTRKILEPWQVPRYKKSRGVSGDDVTKILFHEVVLAADPDQALQSVLQLSGVNRFFTSLSTDRERQDFMRHMEKYINIWLPECPFEVSFTNRYMIDQWESKTTARKFIKAGETIKYLCGNLVSIEMDEQDDEGFVATAFSITFSSRKKTTSLFLGPARFSNHDCNANARLDSRGRESMIVVAVRDIDVGDEINVHYGDNYFGEDNCECLCASCERYGQGAWQDENSHDEGTRTPRNGSGDEVEDPGSRRSKRKRQIVNYKQRLRMDNNRTEDERPRKKRRVGSDLASPTPTSSELKREEKKVLKRAQLKAMGRVVAGRLQKVIPRNESMLAQLGLPTMPPRMPKYKRECSPSPILHVNPWASQEKGTVRPKRRGQHSKKMTGPPPEAYYKSHMLFAFLRRPRVTPRHSPVSEQAHCAVPYSVANPASNSSSEDSSIFDRENERQSESPNTVHSSHEGSSVRADIFMESPSSNANFRRHPQKPSNRDEPTKSPSTRTTTTTSTAAEHVKTANMAHERIPNPGASSNDVQTRKRDLEANVAADADPHPVEAPAVPAVPVPTSPNGTGAATSSRVPGDYIRTPRLLGPKNSRWVECRTCDDSFVQQDAHQTRRECPRCERHSKLYGFQWPLTESERSGPERVMDHRTVNRFLSRKEELEEARRKKLEGLEEKA